MGANANDVSGRTAAGGTAGTSGTTGGTGTTGTTGGTTVTGTTRTATFAATDVLNARSATLLLVVDPTVINAAGVGGVTTVMPIGILVLEDANGQVQVAYEDPTTRSTGATTASTPGGLQQLQRDLQDLVTAASTRESAGTR